MNFKERSFVSLILAGIIVIVALDLAADFRQGAQWWHLLFEGAVAVGALVGIYVLMRDSFSLKNKLRGEREYSAKMRTEAEMWRARSKKYLEGLSQAIDTQLTDWHLTGSEKEVAFLLLKGLSLKEIAEVRKTSEKTARVQSMAIYSKSGLSGRSELAAFFLEDLFMPSGKSESGIGAEVVQPNDGRNS